MVRNNVEGEEARLLARYEEPSWNNPVVRFFGGDGVELLPRKDRVWSMADYAPRLIAALEAADRDVPGWLVLAREEVSGKRASVAFSMPCFWEGEARLGGVSGVIATRPAHLGRREVVEVTYDPARLELEALIRRADALECALGVFAMDADSLAVARGVVGERASLSSADDLRAAKERDALYHLRKRPALFALPATRLQRIRLNAAVRAGGDVTKLLSPRQLILLAQAEALDSRALEGLEPPSDFAALATYRARFVAALGEGRGD